MRSVRPPPKVVPARMSEYQRLGYPSEYAWAQDQGMLEIKGRSSPPNNNNNNNNNYNAERSSRFPSPASLSASQVDPDRYATQDFQQQMKGRSGVYDNDNDNGNSPRYESPRDYQNQHNQIYNSNKNNKNISSSNNNISDFDFEDAVRQEMEKIQRSISDIEKATPSKNNFINNVSHDTAPTSEAPPVKSSVSFKKDSGIDDRNSRITPRGDKRDVYLDDNSVSSSNNNYNNNYGYNNDLRNPPLSQAPRMRSDEDRASLMLGDMYKSADELKKDRRRQQKEYFQQLQTDPTSRSSINVNNINNVPSPASYKQGFIVGVEQSDHVIHSVGSNPNRLGRKDDKEYFRHQQEEYRRQLDRDQLVVDPLGGLRSNPHRRVANDDIVPEGSNSSSNNYIYNDGRSSEHNPEMIVGGRGKLVDKNAAMPPSYRSVEEEKKEMLRLKHEEYRRQLDGQRQEKEALKKKTQDDQIPIYNGHFPTKGDNSKMMMNPQQLHVNTAMINNDNSSNSSNSSSNGVDSSEQGYAGGVDNSNRRDNRGNAGNMNSYGQPISTSSNRSEARDRKVSEVYGKTDVISPDHHQNHKYGYDPSAAFDSLSLEEQKKEKARLKHLEYSRLLDDQRKQKEQIKKKEKDLDELPIYNGKFLIKDKNAPAPVSARTENRSSFDPSQGVGGYHHMGHESGYNNDNNSNAYDDGGNYDVDPRHLSRIEAFNQNQQVHDPYEQQQQQHQDDFNAGGKNGIQQSNYNNGNSNSSSSSSSNNNNNYNNSTNNVNNNLSPKRAARNRKVQEVYGKTEIGGGNEAPSEVMSQEEAKKEQQRKQHEEYRKQLDVQRLEIEEAKRKAKLEKERQDRDDRDREDQFHKASNKRMSVHRVKGDQFKESHELENIKQYQQKQPDGGMLLEDEIRSAAPSNSKQVIAKKAAEPAYISPNKAKERKMMEIYGRTDFTSHGSPGPDEDEPASSSNYSNDIDSAPANAMARSKHVKELAMKAAVSQHQLQQSEMRNVVKAAPPAKRGSLDESQMSDARGNRASLPRDADNSNSYGLDSARDSVADRSNYENSGNGGSKYNREEPPRGVRGQVGAAPQRQSLVNNRGDVGYEESYVMQYIGSNNADPRLSDSFRREIDYSRLRQSLLNERSLNNFDLSQRANDFGGRNDSSSSALNMSYRPTSADETDMLLMQWQMKQQKQGFSDLSYDAGYVKGGVNDYPVIQSHDNFSEAIGGRGSVGGLGGSNSMMFRAGNNNSSSQEDVSLVSDSRLVPADPWAAGGLLNMLGAPKEQGRPRVVANNANPNYNDDSIGYGPRLDQSLVSESYMVYMNASGQGERERDMSGSNLKNLNNSVIVSNKIMTNTNDLHQGQGGKVNSPLSAVIQQRDANAFLKNENNIRSRPNTGSSISNNSNNNQSASTRTPARLNNDGSSPDLLSNPSDRDRDRDSALSQRTASGLQGAGLAVVNAGSSRIVYADLSVNRSNDDDASAFSSSNHKSPKSKGGEANSSLSQSYNNINSLDYSQYAPYESLQQPSKLSKNQLNDSDVLNYSDDHYNSDDNGEIHIIPSSASKQNLRGGSNSNSPTSADNRVSSSQVRGKSASPLSSPQDNRQNNDEDDQQYGVDGQFSGRNYENENDLDNTHEQDQELDKNDSNSYHREDESGGDYDDDGGDFGDLVVAGKSYGSPSKSRSHPNINHNPEESVHQEYGFDEDATGGPQGGDHDAGTYVDDDYESYVDGEDGLDGSGGVTSARSQKHGQGKGSKWDKSPRSQSKVISELNKLSGTGGSANYDDDDDFEK